MHQLTPQNAFIFRITHIDNVSWVLANGLHCANSAHQDPNFKPIGNSDLIDKRKSSTVGGPHGGTLSDYIPFYFTPRSPMLLNIKTGYNGVPRQAMRDIAVLVSSLHELQKQGVKFVFTNRHAFLKGVEFKSSLSDLDIIDWRILQSSDFSRDLNDPTKKERYMAEALVYQHAPVSVLLGVGCHGSPEEQRLAQEAQRLGVATRIVVRPGWYF